MIALWLALGCGGPDGGGAGDGLEPAAEGLLPGECTDGIDNDGDRVVDCDDLDCAAAPPCQPEPTPTDTATTADPTTPTTSSPTTQLQTPAVRYVHVVVDEPAITVHRGDPGAPVAAVEPDGNTDAGADYAPLPEGLTVHVAMVGDEELARVEGDRPAEGDAITVVFYGSAVVGVSQPRYRPRGVAIYDDLRPAEPGLHRLFVYHLVPGAPMLQVLSAGTVLGRVDYADSPGAFAYPAGVGVVELDRDQDGAADLWVTVDLADRSWSNLYLLPDDVDEDGLAVTWRALHHVRGEGTVGAPVVW